MLLIATMTTTMATTSFAVNQETNQNTPTIDTTEVAPAYLEKYSYSWQVDSTVLHNKTFDNWRTGPTGFGPATLSINESSNLDKYFTATFTGQASVGIAKLESVVGVKIGSSKEYGTSFAISLGKNERKTIIYRPRIAIYKVTQGYYRIDNYTNQKTLVKTSVAYVNKFDGWDYSWRYGY